MSDPEKDEELLLRVRKIDNGYLLLGRAYGGRLPQKYFENLDTIGEEMADHLHDHFEPPEDGAEMEGV